MKKTFLFLVGTFFLTAATVLSPRAVNVTLKTVGDGIVGSKQVIAAIEQSLDENASENVSEEPAEKTGLVVSGARFLSNVALERILPHLPQGGALLMADTLKESGDFALRQYLDLGKAARSGVSFELGADLDSANAKTAVKVIEKNYGVTAQCVELRRELKFPFAFKTALLLDSGLAGTEKLYFYQWSADRTYREFEPAYAHSGNYVNFVSDRGGIIAVTGEPLPDPDGWAVFLIDSRHPMPKDYTLYLENITPERHVARPCAGFARPLLADAEKDGIRLTVASAYRSIAKQAANLNELAAEYAKDGYSPAASMAAALREIQRPGCSEHNFGLAADLISPDWYVRHSTINDDFENTEQYRWLAANSWKYGFVVRYQKARANFDDIEYEPWHYRFVGLKTAKFLYENDLTLDEFLSDGA